jgi:hypothetical protein
MYKKVFLVTYYDYFYNNRILQVQENYRGFEDRLYPDKTYPYYLLKKEMASNNVELNTYDFFDKNDKDPYALIFIDVPKNIEHYARAHPNADKFLIEYESPIIGLINKKEENYHHFKKVFTWKSQLADNKKFFAVRYANRIPKNLDFNEKKEKLCVMIAGNKLKSRPGELYTERIRAIKWFEKNHPGDFDLFGVGWDRYYFADNFTKLNRLKFLTKFLRPDYPSYKGPAEEKLNLCKKYKFSICYENCSFPNYISEKIFDSFWSGCVPVYLGAPNVSDYIPAGTFVDKRKFRTYEELYSYLKNMPAKEYQKYLSEIKKFAMSEKIYPFSAECFAKTITDAVLNSSDCPSINSL